MAIPFLDDGTGIWIWGFVKTKKTQKTSDAESGLTLANWPTNRNRQLFQREIPKTGCLPLRPLSSAEALQQQTHRFRLGARPDGCRLPGAAVSLRRGARTGLRAPLWKALNMKVGE